MRQSVDIEKLRAAFRRMTRGNLLCVAERAIELVPRAKLGALVAGMVRLDQLAEGKRGAAPLLDEIRSFHDACLRGDHRPKHLAAARRVANADQRAALRRLPARERRR